MLKQRYEIRYRMPPHGVGSRIARHHDRFDAEQDGIDTYGDDFLEALPYVKPKPGELPGHSEAHDRLHVGRHRDDDKIEHAIRRGR